jgi:hypothetical protein
MLSPDGAGGQQRKRRQQHRAGEKNGQIPMFAQIHIPHFITGLP